MSTYAKSAEVHRILSRAFDPWRRQFGFKRLASGQCAFVKAAASNDSELLAFEVQCSSFGSSAHGNAFTLNAAVGLIDPRNLSGRHARILSGANVDLLAAASALQGKILDRQPLIQPRDRSWQRGNDNWCCYYAANDAQDWGELLALHLSTLLAEFLAQRNFTPEHFGNLQLQI
jgi:hypothetical protein